jgi:hypothetical protein
VTRSTLAKVHRLLAGMPEVQRAVILLVCVQGLRCQEAADTLGIPVGTVMSRLARGRLHLASRGGCWITRRAEPASAKVERARPRGSVRCGSFPGHRLPSLGMLARLGRCLSLGSRISGILTPHGRS